MGWDRRDLLMAKCSSWLRAGVARFVALASPDGLAAAVFIDNMLVMAYYSRGLLDAAAGRRRRPLAVCCSEHGKLAR